MGKEDRVKGERGESGLGEGGGGLEIGVQVGQWLHYIIIIL